MKLRSIAKEAADCRAAWAAMPDARYGVHIHHETVAEILTEPIENRITYILDHKPKDEQALRLRLMRPITAQAWKAYGEAVAQAWKAYDEAEAQAWKAYDEAVAQARKAYDEAEAQAHTAACPTADCPWTDGSIFGGRHER